MTIDHLLKGIVLLSIILRLILGNSRHNQNISLPLKGETTITDLALATAVIIFDAACSAERGLIDPDKALVASGLLRFSL